MFLGGMAAAPLSPALDRKILQGNLCMCQSRCSCLRDMLLGGAPRVASLQHSQKHFLVGLLATLWISAP